MFTLFSKLYFIKYQIYDIFNYGDSMITLEEEKKEKEFLKETSKKLENTINELKKEVNISFSDLTDFKKLVLGRF